MNIRAAALAVMALGLTLACSARLPAPQNSYERTEYVMGTMLSIEVSASDREAARAAVDTAFAEMHRLNGLLSNYDSSSELSQFARMAPGAVTVHDDTWDFVNHTLHWARASGGALNPAIGPVVDAWGFYGEHPARPDSADLARRLAHCDYRAIRLDSAAQTIALSEDMELDPGASGKGYALGRAATRLRGMGITEMTFDFGGQTYREGRDTVLVAVVHPRHDRAAAAWLAFAAGSVATSGDYERYFEVDGQRFSHIIDPRTGFPVRDRAAVSVFAADPFVADVLSTILFVTGPVDGETLLADAGAGALFAEWEADSLVFFVRGQWPAAP